MKAWVVKYQSYNNEDYIETIFAPSRVEALKNAKRVTYKKDDRDKIISIKQLDYEKEKEYKWTWIKWI